MPLPAIVLPAAIIETALNVALEGLKAFNNLPEESRAAIVKDALEDKAETERRWKEFWVGLEEFFSGLKVDE
jgi:hypothetical protein